jgi:hypothetical protein
MKVKIRQKFIMLLIMIIIIQTIRYFPFKFGGWNQIQLSFSYRYGFIQRAFLGTILDIISTFCHIPWKYMRYIYGIFTMGTFTLLTLCIANKSLCKTKDTIISSFLSGLALVFFIGPGWCTIYSNFALTDIWLTMISVAAVYLILREKHLWLIPILSAICVLIHTAYVFLCFNLVLAALFYKIFLKPSAKRNKHIASAIISFFTASCLFLYMMFFAKAKQGITLDYVMERTSEFVSKSLSDVEQHRYTVQGYLFRDGGDSGITLNINSYWLILVIMLIMFSPFIYEVYRYWKYVVIETNALYGLIPFGIVTSIPMYIMHNDYGRWTYQVFFYEFACIWFLNLLNDEGVIKATHKMYENIQKDKTYYIVLLFYAGICGAFSQNLINPMVETLESYAWKILALFGI